MYCRYEYWSANGKVWTNWFKTSRKPDDSDKIDKKTKLKHEYRESIPN